MADSPLPAVAVIAPADRCDDPLAYWYRMVPSVGGYLVPVLNGETSVPLVVQAVLAPVTEGMFTEMDPPVLVSPGRTAWIDLRNRPLAWCRWQISERDLGIVLSGGVITRSRQYRFIGLSDLVEVIVR